MGSENGRSAALAVDDLYSLEEYHRLRPDFRARVLEHKKARQVPLGEQVTLYFEDRLTIQYQVQEMLRIERIFEREAIQEELEAYNPLIPDGTNLKATFMIEIPDAEERRRRLAELPGIEDRLYARVGGHDRLYCIADEDMERSEPDKTAAVHFVRFEFPAGQRAALAAGEPLFFGIDHAAYTREVEPRPGSRAALLADLIWGQ